MKRSILIICVLIYISFSKLYGQALEVSSFLEPAYCSGFNKGSIGLEISGGTAPYTVSWNDNSVAEFREGLKPGRYSYTVKDKDGFTFSADLDLLSCVRWLPVPEVTIEDNTIKKIIGDGWNAGINSLNELEASQQGYVVYTVNSPEDNFAFGFDKIDENRTVHYSDIYYAIKISGGMAQVFVQGILVKDMGGSSPGDVFKIEKTGETIRFYKNTTPMQTVEFTNESLRVEAALFRQDQPISGIKSSFFRPELSADVLQGNLNEDFDNSGYLCLKGKNGLKPYTYKWGVEPVEMITDLTEGRYRGVVKDSVGDSVVVYRSIGYNAGARQRNNLVFTEEGLAKVNNEEKANICFDRYIPVSGNGWLEFQVKDKNKEFNAMIREFDPNPTGEEPPTPFTAHVTEDVVLTAAQIAAYENDGLYSKLNIISSSGYPESVVVQKYKFVDAALPAEDQVVLTHCHGIVSKEGKLYTLYQGSTLFKPVVLADGDVIQIKRQDGVFAVDVNSTGVFEGPVTASKGGGFESNLMDFNLLLWYISQGGGVGWQKTVSCASGSRNWASKTIYDGLGNVIGDAMDYSDVLGRPTQSLHKDITKNNVIACQTLYDAFGRFVLRTLPAPTFQTSLCYINHFLDNEIASGAYNFNNFDVPNWTSNYWSVSSGERDAPQAVDPTYKGGVGWYYSNNNDSEPFVATADRPYHRVEYDITNPSSILRSSLAGIALDHGSGHEVYDLSLKTAGELYYFYGFGNSWKVTDMNNHFNQYSACRSMSDVKTVPMNNLDGSTMKRIHMDENGSESVEFYDAMGSQIGRCLSGSVDGQNQQIQSLLDFIDIDPNSLYKWVDVHLPDGCQNSLVLEQSGNQIIYDIINLKTGRCDQCGFNGTQPVLGPGSYRIKVVSAPTLFSNLIRVRYNTNYYNFTANYYDRADRLRIVVPPEGLSYAGAALSATYFNGNVAKKFFTTDNHAGPIYGGGQPNFTNIPMGWELGSGTGSHEMSLNCVGFNYLLHNFIVKFSGKTTAWSMTHFGDENNPTEAYRTTRGEGAASGDLLKLRYELDGTEEAYSAKMPEYQVQLFDAIDPLDEAIAAAPTNPNLSPNYINAFTMSGSFCTNTVMPVVIQYQIVDGSNQPISGVNVVTGYCTIVSCTGNTTSYSRTWTFPPQNVHLLSGAGYPNNFTARLKILDIYAVHNVPAYPWGVPWQYYTDITADFSWKSGSSQASPPHDMTEVYENNNWGDVIISKTPDSGQTDYIYSPDGKLRASQNSNQNTGEGSNTDKFSYVNFDGYGRPVERGEYQRGVSSASPNIKFKNYKQFLTNSSAPSVIIEANANNPITDVARRKEVVNTYYDYPDPNFVALTGLNPAVFEQQYLTGKISWTNNDEKRTWYSYDELGQVKWMVSRYNNVTETSNPSNSYIIKTFYYNYDYVGNITEEHYQYHLPSNTVSDKMKLVFSHDQDKRLTKVQSTLYKTSIPITKTDVEYTYYLHGPLKRKQLAGNLQGVDYIYTINGWLKGINSPELDVVHDAGQDGAAIMGRVTHNDLFGLTLDYFNGDYERSQTRVQTYLNQFPTSPDYFMSRYNGDIMCQRWQIKEPVVGSGMAYQNKQLIYGYWYDKKNQMTAAQFGEITANELHNTAGGNNKGPDISIGEDYRVLTSYDANGNIKTLSRNAYWGGAEGLYMDDITYNYIPCSNKLNYATDAIGYAPPNAPDPYYSIGFHSGQGSGNYTYDLYGQLAGDAQGNKFYKYNSLGQIIQVDDTWGNKIVEYKYDEAGLRIAKNTYDPMNQTNVVKTLYVRNNTGEVVAIFEKPVSANLFDIKEWNIHGDSRLASVYNTPSKPSYVYEIQDHLGSVRTTFREGVQSSLTTYFGLHMKSADYKYFTDPNNSLVQFQPGNGLSRVYSPGKPIGIKSIDFPVIMGDAINVSIKAKYAGTSLPVGAALVIELYDGFTNQLIGTSTAPVTSASQNDNWATISANLTNNIQNLGWFRVYVRNTGTIACDFDYIQITFPQGGVRYPVQEEVCNYYPHGSRMPGLNYINTLGGRHGYQGEFSDNDIEIEEDFFESRNYNPLLGRFNSVDPADQYFSPYMSMGNNHPNSVDPTGGNAFSFGVGMVVGAAIGIGIAYVDDYFDDGNHNTKWDERYTYGAIGGALVGGIALGATTDMWIHKKTGFVIHAIDFQRLFDGRPNPVRRSTGPAWVISPGPVNFGSKTYVVRVLATETSNPAGGVFRVTLTGKQLMHVFSRGGYAYRVNPYSPLDDWPARFTLRKGPGTWTVTITPPPGGRTVGDNYAIWVTQKKKRKINFFKIVKKY